MLYNPPAFRVDDIARLRNYGQSIGLAFQIVDDVLDVTQTSEQLGKTAGKDSASLKSTYPSVMGLPAAKERAAELFSEADKALSVFGESAAALRWLAKHIQSRNH